MSPSFRFVIMGILGFTLGALVWVSRTIDAQVAAFQALSTSYAKATAISNNGGQPGVFANGTAPPLEPVRTVHLTSQMAPAQVRTWLRLQERIAMPFPDETPFEDVLKYIKTATHKDKEPPIPIYVDPIGLQEAEKTMQSPVILDLEDITLETSLNLMLKQLSLCYSVNKEGLVVVQSTGCDDGADREPDSLMLDYLSELRNEVAALRWEVAVLRTGSPPAGMGASFTRGGMGGSGPLGGGMGALCVY